MATWVSFQAHPDDESIQSGGTLAKAAADGHRTILVFGTGGEHGEVADGFLDDDETLAQRRRLETERSAEILGVARVEFLGYTDSGMMGTPENDLPGSFWTADLEEAAEGLATILREEMADVLTIYDSDGGYGHPDHIQVHRVGLRAAELAGTPHVLEATMNRDHLRRMMLAAVEAGEMPGDDVPDVTSFDTFGRPEDVITTTVDVRQYLPVKRASMIAHASQISDSSFFLAMPEAAFEAGFGQEWYIRHGAPEGHRDDDVFHGVVER
ncbi:MAG: PIG-L family deacetylase [Acidimicrobiales bacterium]